MPTADGSVKGMSVLAEAQRTGTVRRDDGKFFADEMINGKLAGNSVSFTAGYANIPGESDLSYTLTNAPTDGIAATTPRATVPGHSVQHGHEGDDAGHHQQHLQEPR
jgi:hypothetical protein